MGSLSAVVATLLGVVLLLPGDLSAAPGPSPAGIATTQSLLYTRHPASGSATEIISLRIDGPFDAGEKAKVLLAVGEWNHVLNGFVRFDVAAPNGWRPRAWDIRAEKGGSPQAPDPAAGQPLSFTQAGFASLGGKMVVYVDRMGTRDLRGVILHELGHVLGLGHETSGLMSARYSPTTDQCVGRSTAAAIATLRKLPLDGLNWCEPDVPGTNLEVSLLGDRHYPQ